MVLGQVDYWITKPMIKMNLYITIIGLVLIGCNIALLLLVHSLGNHYFTSSSCRQITKGYREAASKLEDEIMTCKDETGDLERMIKPVWKAYESPRQIFILVQTDKSGMVMESQEVMHWIRNYKFKFISSGNSNSRSVIHNIVNHPEWWNMEETNYPPVSVLETNKNCNKQDMIVNINIDRIYKINPPTRVTDTSYDNVPIVSSSSSGGADTINVNRKTEFLARLDINHHACVRDKLSSESGWRMSIVSAQSLFDRGETCSMKFTVDKRSVLLDLNANTRYKRYIHIQQDIQQKNVGMWSLLILLEEIREK